MTTMFSTASIHSLERVKERIGFNEKNAVRQIGRAIERGKTSDQFTSWERNFLENLNDEMSYAVAYNNFCYILGENGCCITVFPLPAWFGKKKRFDGKKRIRNAKVYSRLHFFPEGEAC